MHIAICDDNVADRKQLERLLKREGDTRALTAEGFYIDSFGNVEALLRSPMLFDVFFIDMCLGTVRGTDVADALLKVGVTAPIILCSSQIHYSECVKEPISSNLFFLDKPIKKEELSKAIDHAIRAKASSIPLIELREESGEYCYVTEPQIMYVVAEGAYLKITLTDQRVISILSTLENLYLGFSRYPMLFPISKKVLINARYLTNVKHLMAYMSDGAIFPISLYNIKYAKYALEEYTDLK